MTSVIVAILSGFHVVKRWGHSKRLILFAGREQSVILFSAYHIETQWFISRICYDKNFVDHFEILGCIVQKEFNMLDGSYDGNICV